MKNGINFGRHSFMKFAMVQVAFVVAITTAMGNKPQPQAHEHSKVDKKPNIVVIVADDHRWDLMSCAGSKYSKTPNMDRLANEGVYFRNAFACSGVCSPSRASILTGKYCHQAASPRIVWTNNSFRMQEKPFPARLHDAGYHSAHFGKWHLGAGDTAMDGYDHWAGFEWLGAYFDTQFKINGEVKSFKGFSDDIISNLAAEYITERAKSDQPFCAYVGLKAPHLDFQYPPRLEHVFDGVDIPKPDSYNEDYSETGRLDYLKRAISVEGFVGGLPMFDNSWEKYVKSYYRSALAIDDAVGNILKALDDAGIADDTIVIYTSDQGYTLGEHGLTEKHFAHEEAMRVPMIIRYPEMIRPGVQRDELALTIDIAPTLMDICNGSVPADMVGRSWKPLLLSDEKKYGDWRKDFFFETVSPGNDIPGPVAVRTDRYKLITYPWIDKEHVELFDLKTDPKEMKNLWKDPDYQDVLKDMFNRLERLKKETDWTKVIEYPLESYWTMGPVPNEHLEVVRQAAISDKMCTPEKTNIKVGTASYTWQQGKGVNGKLDLKEIAGEKKEGTVFLAIPMERLSDTDPYVLTSISPIIAMKGYVNGRKCHDTPGGPGPVQSLMAVYNPPLSSGRNIFVLEFAAGNDLSVVFSAPEGKLKLLSK